MKGILPSLTVQPPTAVPQKRWRRLGWALLRPLRRYVFLSRVLVRERESGACVADAVTGVSIRAATPDELLKATVDLPVQLESGFVPAALARGDVCLAAFQANRMIAFVWRAFATAPHSDGVCVRIDPPFWYTYKSYTHPDFRGQRLSGLLTVFGDTVCVDRGRVRGVGFIELGNEASLRANLRLGTRPVGYAGYVRLFGRVFPFRTPGAVRSTFRFCRSDS